jgi:protein TonB
MMIPDPIRSVGPPRAKAFLGWSAALFLSGALHAGAFALALNWRQPGSISAAAPPAVMIDLLPAAPAIPKIEAAPGPQAPDSAEQPDKQHVRPPPDRAAEPAPSLPQQDVAVTIPEPTPAPATQSERPREETKKLSEQRTIASRSAAPQTFEAPRHATTPKASAVGARSASPAALASWRSELMARLNRYKRYPPGAVRDGTSLVAFNINRSGAVTAAHLARSSGDSTLDQEAVSLPRRASPLPAPPEGIAAGSIALTVPIHFER